MQHYIMLLHGFREYELRSSWQVLCQLSPLTDLYLQTIVESLSLTACAVSSAVESILPFLDLVSVSMLSQLWVLMFSHWSQCCNHNILYFFLFFFNLQLFGNVVISAICEFPRSFLLLMFNFIPLWQENMCYIVELMGFVLQPCIWSWRMFIMCLKNLCVQLFLGQCFLDSSLVVTQTSSNLPPCWSSVQLFQLLWEMKY